ncbi:hypothetical protein DDE01_11860 [Desulfovibrio desulfuricans]|nr:hypothetical protein DDE01_11860 [Desulfovibrio desulfuricans]
MSNSKQSGGIGFCGALAILFIALKLTDKIDWSWWWVLSPVWVPFALCVVAVLAVAFGASKRGAL